MPRSRRKPRRKPLSEINVTPIVDVMLVLLIVFMVAAPLMVVGIPVDLPKTGAAPMREEVEPLTISIRADGQTYLQDEDIALSDLITRMSAILGENREARVYVRADGHADYALVADVMARLQQAGFRHIGLVTEPLES